MSPGRPRVHLLTALLLLTSSLPAAAESLVVVSDFEGASVSDVVIEQAARVISFRPGGEPQRGWPCWWYFQVDGTVPGETLTFRFGSGDPAAQATPKLAATVREAAAFSMPAQATAVRMRCPMITTATGRSSLSGRRRRRPSGE
jgi:hypothetical protein